MHLENNIFSSENEKCCSWNENNLYHLTSTNVKKNIVKPNYNMQYVYDNKI